MASMLQLFNLKSHRLAPSSQHSCLQAGFKSCSPLPFTVPKVSQRILPLGLTNSWREMSCCAGLGTPPPREIIVEYCEESDYTDFFIKLADSIEDAYPELVVLGNPDDMQSRRGSFEIKSGDSILFSKLKANRMPNVVEVLKAIDSLPPQQCEMQNSGQVVS